MSADLPDGGSDPIETACTAFLNAEFDELQPVWFQPGERATYIRDRIPELLPEMRAAMVAYLRARAQQGFPWLDGAGNYNGNVLLNALAAEVKRNDR